MIGRPNMKLFVPLVCFLLFGCGHAELYPPGINWNRTTQTGLEGVVVDTHYDRTANFLWGATVNPVGLIKINPFSGETVDFFPTGNDADARVSAFVPRPVVHNENQVSSFILMIEGIEGQGSGRMAMFSTSGEELWSNDLGSQGTFWNPETVSPLLSDEYETIFVNFRTNMVLGAFNATDGAMLWSNSDASIELGRMTQLGVKIYAGQYRSNYTTDDFKPSVLRFSQISGEVTANWTLDCDDCLGSIRGAPVVSANLDSIYFSDIYAGNVALGQDLSEHAVARDGNQYFPFRMGHGQYLYGVSIAADGAIVAAAYGTTDLSETRWLSEETESGKLWAGDVILDGPRAYYLQQNQWFGIRAITGEVEILWKSEKMRDEMLSMTLSSSDQTGVDQALFVSYQTEDSGCVLLSFTTEGVTPPPTGAPTVVPTPEGPSSAGASFECAVLSAFVAAISFLLASA